MLRDEVEEIPSKCLFLSQLYISGDRFHDFPSIFWVNLLPCAAPISKVRFSSLPLTGTWEHKSITHHFLAHFLAYSHSKQEKLTVFGTAFLRGLYPLRDILCLWRSPGVQCLADSSDFLTSFWLHLVLPVFSCLVSLPNPFVLAHQASPGTPIKGDNLYQPFFHLIAQCFGSSFVLVCCGLFLCHFCTCEFTPCGKII